MELGGSRIVIALADLDIIAFSHCASSYNEYMNGMINKKRSLMSRRSMYYT